jgi:hypothetical protein
VRAAALVRSVFITLLSATAAGAQTYEMVGTRAQGMSGAFVAVANDATATWWNPAGIATGAYFSAVVERSSRREPVTVPPDGPAEDDRASGFSVAFPAMGLSYYRFRISEIAPVPPTASGAAGRQDQGNVSLRTAPIAQFGVTVAQSIGDHLVTGSTLKILRGGSTGRIETAAGGDSLEHAIDLEVSSETHTDLDVGAIARFGPVHLGLNVRHLTKPEFGEGATRFDLGRQARAGVAVLGKSPGIVSSFTMAVDADLTRTPTALGDVRHLAAGAEVGLRSGRLAVRGGVAKNTVEEDVTSASVGGSIGLRSGVFLDGALTRGSDASEKGWSAALRMTF